MTRTSPFMGGVNGIGSETLEEQCKETEERGVQIWDSG